MRKDPTEFRERFLRWKKGELVYENGLALPAYRDGEWNPNDTYTADAGMIKSKLAIASHFGNPTARRMTNYDGRDYTWPGEYEYINGVGEPKRGNVYVGSYDNLVTPQILDNGNVLEFVDNPWSSKNESRSYKQSLKFNKMRDAWSFGENYKKYAPMMNNYEDGKLPEYKGGLTPHKKSEVNTNEATYNPEEDLYTARYTVPEVTVTGRKSKVGTGYGKRLYMHPWKTVGDLIAEENAARPSVEEIAARAPYEKDLHKPLSPVDPIGELIVGNAVGSPVFNYVGKAASPIVSATTNAVKRKATSVIKPISKYLQGEDIKNRMVNSAKDLNWTKKWNDDTSVRWWLNGEQTPDFKFVFHGRGTNRGQAKDVLKNHSYKDVGLHVTENQKTALKFAGNDGVMYEGVDTGIYPDAIYPDMTMWHAKAWDDLVGPTSKYTKKQIAEEIQLPYMSKVGQKELGNTLAFRDLMDNFGISYDDIKNYSRRQLFAGNNELEMEAANKLFANYLKSKGVNFRYKNDFEGGGYNKPSAFITDLDLVWWSPQHKAVHNVVPYDSKKTIDWVNAKARILLNPKTNEEWDAAYNAALRSGNINEALRLRDLHFEAKATDNKLKGLFYHGTDKKWNRYNHSYFSSGSGDLGAWGKGLYLSGDKSVAESYGKNIMRLYAYAKSPLEVKPTLEGYLSNPTENAAYYFNRKDIPSNFKPLLKDVDAVNKHGLVFGDGWNFSYKPYEEVVIPKGQQIKSAEAITRDDAGNIIPLSKRDNFKINDIRYGLLPIIGTTGYSMYNSK